MALTWDVTKIKDYETNFPDIEQDGKKLWNPATDALVWAMLAIDIMEITESNVDEVFTRISMWEQTCGAFRYKGTESIYFSYEEIVKHIGFRTNISNRTSKQFDAKIAKVIRRDAQRILTLSKAEFNRVKTESNTEPVTSNTSEQKQSEVKDATNETEQGSTRTES